jgi:alkanesulfonate monooxygenase SsuD/methylene tetrahydromethanopterin reductase-like flavin-dependent oxidoreductase (luciferase family)
MAPEGGLHLAVALEGAGWHPAAWREPTARPGELLTAPYWRDLVVEAERGLLDFATIEDSPAPPGSRVDRVRGRLDAVLIASRVAPHTEHIGFLPTSVVTHTEPFHLSKAIATLDHVSSGRAGIRATVSTSSAEFAHFGRRELPESLEPLFDEGADWVEVLRRLWDSWEDDAEIRDVATGRFIDREKLHHIDFEGEWFTVRGPSITPRPPQGQPVVGVLAHVPVAYRLAARQADVVFTTPREVGQISEIDAQLRAEEQALGREPVMRFADVEVLLDSTVATAGERRDRLDALDGAEHSSDALQFTGTPGDLADLLVRWADRGLDGFRLRPATLPHDLTRITRELVPELQRRGVFREQYRGSTLREHLGLTPRPANRYAGDVR